LQTPLGFSPNDVLSISMVPPSGEPDRQAYYERVVRALADRADVVAASAAGSTPFSGQFPDEGVVAANGSPLPAGIVHALPGFFAVAGIPLRAGRVSTLEDARADPDVAVVSESAARVLFGRSDPLGARVRNRSGREYRVIGVVGDVTHALSGGATSVPPPVYVIPGESTRALTVVARVRHRNAGSLAAIAADLRPLAADSPPRVEWWADRIAADHAYRDPRFQMIVLGSLAGLALGLTALGIASVVAYLVSARTREIGVRVAVGAPPGSLVRLIVGQSLLPVVAGVVAGLGLAQVLRGFIAAQLASANTPAAIETHDPALLIAAAGTVAAAALAAAYLPARRASRIDPTDALRAE
jgi:putative ABC transport system permease protein